MPVINPGDWFGKTWLIEIGVSYSPFFLIVEADSIPDAIDELADHEKYGHHIIVKEEDLGDYPEGDRHYGASGQVLDLDHLMIHGQEGSKMPFPCTYHGEGLPTGGVKPTEFGRDEIEAQRTIGGREPGKGSLGSFHLATVTNQDRTNELK